MTRWRCVGFAVVAACGTLVGCAGGEPGGDGDCVSHYDVVARASTWEDLAEAMRGLTERGRVASVRTQARGADVVGAGREDVVRVVDLLDRDGRRVAQVDVWRTDRGEWRAGAWKQCID